MIASFLLALAVPIQAQPTPARLRPEPAALELIEKDWVLMNWALKYFDANHDILLEPDEAAAAADAFRRLADTNHDGRVTPEEYRAARESILKQD
ncbi:MAG TPA: hypothetical protein VHS33_07240 [Sphingomicrobium sp.]|nr:hypothetical protein [Sphingomicrobium sp.]